MLSVREISLVYIYFIIDASDIPLHDIKLLLSYDNFKSEPSRQNEFVTVKKRVANYFITRNYINPDTDSRRIINLNIESIDIELYNSIDKLQLWIEIFNKFVDRDTVQYFSRELL